MEVWGERERYKKFWGEEGDWREIEKSVVEMPEKENLSRVNSKNK